MVSFSTAIKNGFKKTFDFSGVATRAEYWWWFLFRTLSWFVIIGSCALLTDATGYDGWLAVALIVCGLLLIPSLSLAVRRLHDAGHSGGALLLLFVPFPIAQYYVMMWLTQPSDYRSIYRKQTKLVTPVKPTDEEQSLMSHDLTNVIPAQNKSLHQEDSEVQKDFSTEVKTKTITASVTEKSIVQCANDNIGKVEELPIKKNKARLPKWIKNWNIKNYNRYFVQIYVLYHLIFLMILQNETCYSHAEDMFSEIWKECDWYIPFQFVIPYTIYLGVIYFVEFKIKKHTNEDK